jgi:hypothetical protein
MLVFLSAFIRCKDSGVQMLKSANGIEHACNHLMTNFERFLQLGNVLDKLELNERDQVVSAIRRVMISTEKVYHFKAFLYKYI